MSGRRAKQRRRMVVMAESGDRAARAWCRAHMTRGQIRRASQRMTYARARATINTKETP